MEQEAGKISKKRGSEVSPLALYLSSTSFPCDFPIFVVFLFVSQQRFRRGERISAEEEEGRTENPVFRLGCQVDGLLGLRQLLRREEELQRLRHLAGLGRHEEGTGKETEGTQTP